MTNDSKRCPRCGQANHCQSESYQAIPPFKCWCEQVTVPEFVVANIKQAGYDAHCLCQTCLSSMIDEVQ